MARPRIISDAAVFVAIRALLAGGGDKAVGFGPVSRATGLSAPTLVQRYGSQPAMVETALLAAWDDLDHLLEAAESQAPLNAKGAGVLLKLLDSTPVPPSLTIKLRDRAATWRRRVEAALAQRLGSVTAAAILFAAWQGRMMWSDKGNKGFTLKDLIRKITLEK
jgi:AcrR family transcriptional regulator